MEKRNRSPKSAPPGPAATSDPVRRQYRMQRRAEIVDGTRRRITEAAMRLHTTIGPSETTIAGIAEEAGVTRLTVYRHFRDQDELFEACMGHWQALHPAPDPAGWREIPTLAGRARRAIADVYRWYAVVGHELYPIQRDAAAVPVTARERAQAGETARVEALVGKTATKKGGEAAGRLHAAATLVLTLGTWRTLVLHEGLPIDEAVEIGVRTVVAAGS